MSLLDRPVTFTFHGRALEREQAEALAQIPGVRPFSRSSVTCPYNAVDIVESLLTRWSFSFAKTGLPVLPTATKAQLKNAMKKTELHDWLWEPDADRRPESGFALTEYQIETVLFGLARGAAAFWLPAGSGKTITAFMAAFAKPGPILVVTAANARVQQARELRRCSTARPYVLKPRSLVRAKDEWHSLTEYLEAAEDENFRPVVIVGWEQLADAKAYLLKVKFQTVIWDEIHKGKAKRREKWVIDEKGDPKAKKLNNIVSAAYELACAIPRRFATTATAVRNRLEDLYMQLCLIEPHAWGRTATRFLFRYCAARNGEWGLITSGMSNVPELVHRLEASVYRVPYEVIVAQLPPKRRITLRVPPECLVKPLARTREEASEEAQQEKTKQWQKGRERALLDAASAKRPAILDLVLEHTKTGKGKILVFSGRRRDVEHLGESIQHRLKTMKVWAAHGGHTGDERQDVVDEFMAHPGPCVAVLSIDAFGQSLNIQDTDVIICGMLPSTPGQVDQMEGRGYRLGMNRGLLVIYVVGEDTYDEHVIEELVDKLAAVEGVASSGAVAGLKGTLVGLDRKEQILAGLAGAFASETADEWGLEL